MLGSEKDRIKEENLEKRIQELFRKEYVSTIVLAGKAGIGKSWMAKKASVCALKEDIFDILWVYLSVKHKKRDLYQSIAGQLSVHSTVTEEEIDTSKNCIVSADKVSEDEGLKVSKNISTTLSGNMFLLMLDDEGKKMSTEENEISNLFQFHSGNISKLLITSVNENARHKTNGS